MLHSSSRNSENKESYSLISTRSFLKDLSKFDRVTNRRILQTTELLSEDPRLGKMLRGQLEGLWSLRVGEFRVIYSIEEGNRTITLRAVGHRSAVYTC